MINSYLKMITSSLLLVATHVAGAGVFSDEIDANANSVKYVGSNIIAKGDAVIYFKDYKITADKVVVNMNTKDFEATGSVSVKQRVKTEINVTTRQLERITDRLDILVERIGTTPTPTGEHLTKVEITANTFEGDGSSVVGNLTTGFFEFDEFVTKASDFYIKGDHATKMPSGVIDAANVKLSSCEYLQDGHEHYSISAKTLTMTPEEGTTQADTDSSDVFGNPTEFYIALDDVKIHAGPLTVMWLPYFTIMPVDEFPTVGFKYGSNNKWGSYAMLSKKFKIPGTPYHPRFMLDYFSDRGFGKGVTNEYLGKDSYTEFLAYDLTKDKDRNESLPKYETDEAAAKRTYAPLRFELPKDRNIFMLNHWKHINPRLDFRTSINKISDIKFMEDFFKGLDDENPQPASFAELDYQFDNASANIMVRPRLNDFYSVVERLPELSLDFYRQPLDSNIYFESTSSFADMEMKWRKYDTARTEDNGVDPADYSSSRFDSLNMLYAPMKAGFLNIIPRAGVRVTAYSDSSKADITKDNLETMFEVDTSDRGEKIKGTNNVVNYDKKGGSKLRFIGEAGIEFNAKFYKSWQDVKSPFWNLDGMRHVFVPYVNYNYTSRPSEDRDNLYFFDSIDRLDEQHFVRVGLKNRLQTRAGNYGSQSIKNWLSVENYIDYDFNPEENFNNLHAIGTIVNFTPSERLRFTTKALVNPGGKDSGLKYFSPSVKYSFNDQWRATASYTYTDEYEYFNNQSMGTTLNHAIPTSDYGYRTEDSHSLFASLDFPIYNKTYGQVSSRYDFEQGYFTRNSLDIVQNLHCWDLIFQIEHETDEDDGKKKSDLSFSYSARLTAQPENYIEPFGGNVFGRTVNRR